MVMKVAIQYFSTLHVCDRGDNAESTEHKCSKTKKKKILIKSSIKIQLPTFFSKSKGHQLRTYFLYLYSIRRVPRFWKRRKSKPHFNAPNGSSPFSLLKIFPTIFTPNPLFFPTIFTPKIEKNAI